MPAPNPQAKIVDLVPRLKSGRDRRGAGSRPGQTPGNTLSFEFIDVIDDTPPPHSAIWNQAGAISRPTGTARTWQLFLGMTTAGALCGVAVGLLFRLLAPNVPTDQLLAMGASAMLAGVVTAYANYRLTRRAARSLLGRVHERSRALFGVQVPDLEERALAGELDQLDLTVGVLLEELKGRMDHQKRMEHNDLVQTITALATAIEARDPYTRNHSRSVARLSVRLGRAMGLSRTELYELHLGGLMHDIGKIGVADDILLKPGKLTPEEVRAIQAHVDWSYSIISPISSLRSVSLIVRHHHERFDGKGYPDGLTGEEIPLGARIVAVVDMFVAMTENRPYRTGLSLDVAVGELRRVSGAQIDPACTEAFLEVLRSDGVLREEQEDAVEDAADQPAADEDESKRAAAN